MNGQPEVEENTSNTELKKYFAHMDHAGKSSSADKVFFDAAKEARLSTMDEGIFGIFEGYSDSYAAKQAVKAACVTREEVAHILIIQRHILKRLDRNRNYMWAIIVLLLYIASQFK